MLKRLGPDRDNFTERFSPDAVVRIGEATLPQVFPWRLEYNCPVHENWNIVHTGMLIPEAHQIYVCSTNCLRGVIMTADEMDAWDRISSVMPTENEVVGGRLEEVTIEGVTDVIHRLPKRPRAVELYLVCMHHLMGADERYIYDELMRRFPDIDFVRCWMDPIMQKISLTPEQKQRRGMMALIPELPVNEGAVSVLGDNLRLPESSDISRLLARLGIRVKQVMDCPDYDTYRQMGDSFFLITRSALSVCGLTALAKRNHRGSLYLPPVAGDAQIGEELSKLLTEMSRSLGRALSLDLSSFLAEERAGTKAAFAAAHDVIGGAPVWIDYVGFPRPLSLARRLLAEGFHVTRVLLDAVSGEEREDFAWLKEHHPELELQSTSHVEARQKRQIRETLNPPVEGAAPACGSGPFASDKILALGPKAAFFADTPYFVNWIENDGSWGYDGLRRLADAMTDAWEHPKDTRDLVQRKGLGLPSCVEKPCVEPAGRGAVCAESAGTEFPGTERGGMS